MPGHLGNGPTPTRVGLGLSVELPVTDNVGLFTASLVNRTTLVRVPAGPGAR